MRQLEILWPVEMLMQQLMNNLPQRVSTGQSESATMQSWDIPYSVTQTIFYTIIWRVTRRTNYVHPLFKLPLTAERIEVVTLIRWREEHFSSEFRCAH